MITVQVISHAKEKQEGHIVYTKIATPRSLDEFDLDIIDLTDENLWYCDNYAGNLSLRTQRDLESLSTMIENTKKARILFVLPQDIMLHRYSGSSTTRNNHTEKQYKRTRIKDELQSIAQHVFSAFGIISRSFSIVYENTETVLNETSYRAAFYFSGCGPGITESNGSNKPTTINPMNRYYLTTLDIFASDEMLNGFINSIFAPSQREAKPEWIWVISFYDDTEQESVIEEQKRIIQTAESTIEVAKAKLETNQRYKSILYTNGDELVEVVFDILQILLECDLSQFVDEKREDFLVHNPVYTLIGEIKGITSNVRNEHITQLETHYQQYMDQLEEKGITENVHQLLIINPLRNKPVSEREPVHEKQIALATRNGSLIIETVTLLRLFELFLQNKVTTDKCIELFTERVGILKPSDFE